MDPYKITVARFLGITALAASLCAYVAYQLWARHVPADLDDFAVIAYGCEIFVLYWSNEQLRWHTFIFPGKTESIAVCALPPAIQYLIPLSMPQSVSPHFWASLGVTAATFCIVNYTISTLILRRLPERSGIWDLSNRI